MRNFRGESIPVFERSKTDIAETKPVRRIVEKNEVRRGLASSTRRVVYTYDTEGRVVQKNVVFSNALAEVESTAEFLYDEAGNCTHESSHSVTRFHNRDRGERVSDRTTEYVYDEQGRKISEETAGGARKEWEYSIEDEGRVQIVKHKTWESVFGGRLVLSASERRETLNEQGKVEHVLYSYGFKKGWYRCSYDDQGRLAQTEYGDVDQDGNKLPPDKIAKQSYSEDGRILTREEFEHGKKVSTEKIEKEQTNQRL